MQRSLQEIVKIVHHHADVKVSAMTVGIHLFMRLFRVVSFLLRREQRVAIDHVQSEGHVLTSGVPQGRCLAPVLFLIYASRMFKTVSKHLPSAHAFADGIQLYFSFISTCSFSQSDAIRFMKECIGKV